MTSHRLLALGLIWLLGLGTPLAAQVAERAPATRPTPQAARALLQDSLRKLAGLQSLRYTADYEFEIPDPQATASSPNPDPAQVEAPPVFLEGSAPQIRQRATARVTWNRLPSPPNSDVPRVQFDITGGVRTLGPVQRPARGAGEKPAAKAPPANDPPPSPKPPDAKTSEVPLRIAFNGTLLRALVPESKVVFQYDSLDGEFNVAGLGLFNALLDSGFLPGAVTPEVEPEGTQVVALPPEKVNDELCHVIEVRVPLAQLWDDAAGAGAEEAANAQRPQLVPMQVRRLFVAQSDLLPRRVMVFPPGRVPAGEGEESTEAPPGPRERGANPEDQAQIPEGMRGREAPASQPVVVTFRELEPNSKVRPTDFELEIPAGYEVREVVDDLVSKLETGDPLPDFEWQSAKGEAVGWREISADLVLLVFWATWDHPNCRITLQMMQELHEELGEKGLTVTGVSLDADAEEILQAKQLVAKRKYTYRMYYNASDFAEDIGLMSLPHVILLDAEGKVLYQHTGDDPKTEKRLRRELEKRLPARTD
ncbi:MAG: TlpA family protein disulfide reductase [Planctomycetaceae bacterium]